MKFRTASQVAETRDGKGFVAANVFPLKANLTFVGSSFTVKTLCYTTRVSLENCVELRHYKWWSFCNYRAVVKRDGVYRIVDFRGGGPFKDPAYFELLGYKVRRIENFWRRSSDADDEEKHGMDSHIA